MSVGAKLAVLKGIISRPFGGHLRLQSSGFSILEVLISAAILSIIVVVINQGLIATLAARRNIKENEDFLAVEQILRSAIFQSVGRYLEFDGCADKGSAAWSLRTRLDKFCSDSVSITYALPASAGIPPVNDLDFYNYRSGVNGNFPVITPSWFAAAVFRCPKKQMSYSPPQPDYRGGRTGAYFCLEVEPAGTGSASNYFLRTNTVFVEVFFYSIDLESNTPLTCGDYLSNGTFPRDGRSGRAVYTIYWVKNNSGSRRLKPTEFHRYTGVIAGQTKPERIGTDPIFTGGCSLQ